MNKTPQAVESCHAFLKWLIPQLDKFPRSRRFTLGERLESCFLEILGLLVEAAYSARKQGPLGEANRRLAVARHLWRLCFELEVIPMRRYQHGAEAMNDIGRQIGGWLKAAR